MFLGPDLLALGRQALFLGGLVLSNARLHQHREVFGRFQHNRAGVGKQENVILAKLAQGGQIGLNLVGYSVRFDFLIGQQRVDRIFQALHGAQPLNGGGKIRVGGGHITMAQAHIERVDMLGQGSAAALYLLDLDLFLANGQHFFSHQAVVTRHCIQHVFRALCRVHRRNLRKHLHFERVKG